MIDPEPAFAVEQLGTTIVLAGDIDAATAPLLAAKFAESADVHRLTLDAGAVTFIDSSGLRVVLSERQRRQADGLELVVLRPSAPMVRVIELTGLGPYLCVEPPLNC
jgi:anti-sigma B factor antagonist